MRSPARRQPSDAEIHARLSARIEALEDRVRRLEQHVRRTASALRTPATTSAKAVQASPQRPRPRCPGCTLELPRGRSKETCVWCGFHFAAVRRRRRAGKG